MTGNSFGAADTAKSLALGVVQGIASLAVGAATVGAIAGLGWLVWRLFT